MMSESEFIAKVTPIFRQELELEDLAIDMQTNQDGLEGWDSLAHVRIVIGVEREFSVQLDAAEIESIKSVGDFYAAVTRHLG